MSKQYVGSDGTSYDRVVQYNEDGTTASADTSALSLEETQQEVLTAAEAIQAATEAIKTAVEILDNIVSGSEAQVDVVGALPTGTNTVGAVKDAGPAEAGTHTLTVSADMTTTAAISPAPASGQKLVLREIQISVDTAMNVILEEETTATDFYKFFLPENGSISLVFRYPKKLPTADKKWFAKASATGNIAITAVTTSEA